MFEIMVLEAYEKNISGKQMKCYYGYPSFISVRMSAQICSIYQALLQLYKFDVEIQQILDGLIVRATA